MLDLRSKVNDLERELTQKRAELVSVIENLESKTDQLGITNKELERYKREVSNLTEKLTSTETIYLDEKNEKERLESELNKLELEKAELEKKNSEMESKIKDANEKINEMGQKISEKDQEISKRDQRISEKEREKMDLKLELEKQYKNKEVQLKSEMEGEIVTMNQKLAEKDKLIADIKASIESQLSVKNKEIEAVKADLKANLYDIDKLTIKNQELEHKIIESQKALDKMQKIKETISVKGFLSDKELEEILRSV
ncbi:MAG: hypothetical protein JW891_18735 [Candidatus Lokiarchaeota archaeon]|nr:hypothetical protein [Candidatus Lokiarchaeota archaeon]